MDIFQFFVDYCGNGFCYVVDKWFDFDKFDVWVGLGLVQQVFVVVEFDFKVYGLDIGFE